MSTRTKLLIFVLLILVAYAVISRLGPEIGPIPNPVKTEKCLKLKGKPVLFATGSLLVVNTDSPGVDTYALRPDGSIAWKMELPGKATYSSWWKDRVAIGTDSGALVVVGEDGSVLDKMKFNGEVQFIKWSDDGRLAVVTRIITPKGEVATLQLPWKVELGGYATYMDWLGRFVLVALGNGSSSWIELIGMGGPVLKRTMEGRVLDVAEAAAISLGDKVVVMDAQGRESEIPSAASVGCWRKGKLYLGGAGGLYVYDGSLKKLVNGSVVELNCERGVGAAIQVNGSWSIYMDGQIFRLDGRPYNLQWSPDASRLAFSIQGGMTGIAGNGLITVRGLLGGWVEDRVAVYRDGNLCLVPP